MASDTTHTKYIHRDGYKNNHKMERMNEEIGDREKVIRCIENMYSRIFAGLWIYQIIADLIWGIYDKILDDKREIIITEGDKW